MKTYLKKVKNFFQVCQEQEDGKNRVICTVYRESDAIAITKMFELQNFVQNNYCCKST